MAQRSQMVYAYFRFYVDEASLIAGMEQYCTGWEHMFAVGYNYKEYKCFVDNLGGFEHWVGDMRGYVSPTREVGFIDGSPSDGLFDQTLMMGEFRLMLDQDDILLLNGFTPNTVFRFRKISCQDSGIAHKFEIKSGGLQKILHPVMYTFDSSQIEVLSQNILGLTDLSDVTSFSVMVDIGNTPLKGSEYSNNNLNNTNPANMFDMDIDTFSTLEEISGGYSDVIFDMGATFTNIAIKLKNWYGPSPRFFQTWVYYSDDAVSWTELNHTTLTSIATYTFETVGISARYVKIFLKTQTTATAYTSKCDVYELICS